MKHEVKLVKNCNWCPYNRGHRCLKTLDYVHVLKGGFPETCPLEEA
jgi:hypothetical protein